VLVVSCALKTPGKGTAAKQKTTATPNFPRMDFSYLFLSLRRAPLRVFITGSP
jgi:hypothetical protein